MFLALPIASTHFALFFFFLPMCFWFTCLHSLMCGSCVKGAPSQTDWSGFRDRGGKSPLANRTCASEFSHSPFLKKPSIKVAMLGYKFLELPSWSCSTRHFSEARLMIFSVPECSHSTSSCCSWCPACLLDYEHVHSRDCVWFTVVCTWPSRKCPLCVCLGKLTIIVRPLNAGKPGPTRG